MIKFSKLFLLAAASLSFFGSCSDDDTIIYPEPEFGDYVSVNPESASVSSKGGKASVMVTSNGEWTLSGESAYVTPSATTGKDGEVVTFAVNPNDKHEDQVFTYTFKNGQKTANYTITLLRKALDELTIDFAEGSNNVAYTGGEVKVIVVSNNAWTLEGTSDFVTPSAIQGTDGDEVVFTVKANDTDAERAAKFQFKNGEKVVDFEIKQAAYVETIELAKAEAKLSYNANNKYQVAVKTNVSNRELTAEIPAEATWVKFKGALPGTDGVNAMLDIQENRTTATRTAVITFKGTKGASAVFTLIQMPKVILSVQSKSYSVKKDATSYEVPVTANVEFDVKVSAEGNGWFTFNSVAENVIKFDVKPLENETPRTCTVTLTEKNPAENVKAVVVVFNINQKPAGLISCAADMRRSRTHFSSIPNSQPLYVSSWSMEALVNIQEARERGNLSTIMGIEGTALLRMGDANLPWNQLQVTAQNETSVTGTESQLSELNRWYHIAFTYNYETKSAKLYIDGELKLTAERYYRTTNFAVAYYGSEGQWNRAFWIGYSYDSNRYFPGYMSEMRLWNRELSKEEINAKNHFYQVDPNSEGLIGYWKLDDGSGYVVKDYSPSGNNMEGEINVRHHNNNDTHSGEPGMNWVEVNIG